MVYQGRFLVETAGHRDMQNITDRVQAVVTESRVMIGTVHVFNVGSTGAIGTIEFEPGLKRDLPELLDRLIPPNSSYGHEQTWRDGNGHSHLQATWLGPSLTVPITDNRLLLGTWQQIFHLECDIRSRKREVVVTIMGD
jgi:secondary thiamine-phosphate synthase enzyme